MRGVIAERMSGSAAVRMISHTEDMGVVIGASVKLLADVFISITFITENTHHCIIRHV